MESMIMLTKEEADRLQRNIPDVKILTKVADFFSVFSDPTRVKIMTALCLYDLCVSDLAILLGINQTTVSHQLKYLKQNNIVQSSRDGKMIYYSIDSGMVEDIMSCGLDYLN